MNISKRKLCSLATVCAIFSIFSIKWASAYKFHYRKTKLKLDLQSQKTTSLLITIKVSMNIQIEIFVCRSDFSTTTLALFPSKGLNYTAMNLYLQKLSTLIIAIFTTSTLTNIKLRTSEKKMRAKTMCSTFNLDCPFDSSILKIIANAFCLKGM